MSRLRHFQTRRNLSVRNLPHGGTPQRARAYASGRIWALTTSATNTLLVNSNLTISSFGIDDKELYVCAFDGKIYNLNTTNIPEYPLAVPLAALVIITLMLATVFRKSARAAGMAKGGSASVERKPSGVALAGKRH